MSRFSLDPVHWSTRQILAHDAETIQELARRAAATGQAYRVVLGRCILAIHESKLYEPSGYSSAIHYAIRVLGLGQKEACEYRRVAACLETLPKLSRAAELGGVPWGKLREVVRKASPRTEEFWLRLCAHRDDDEIAFLCRCTEYGKLPWEGVQEPETPITRRNLHLDPKRAELFEQMALRVAEKVGRPLSVVEAIEHLAVEELTNKPATPQRIKNAREEAGRSHSASQRRRALMVAEAQELAEGWGLEDGDSLAQALGMDNLESLAASVGGDGVGQGYSGQGEDAASRHGLAEMAGRSATCGKDVERGNGRAEPTGAPAASGEAAALGTGLAELAGRSFTCGKDVERGNGRAEPTGAPAAFGEAATFGTGPAEMAGRSPTCGKDVERGNGLAEPTGAPAASGEAATFGTGPAEMAGRSFTCGKDVERGNGRAEPTGAPAAFGEAATLGAGPAEMAGRSATCGKDVERGNGRAEPTGAPAASGEAATLGAGPAEMAGRSATCGKDVERGNGLAEPTGAPAASGETATLGTGLAELAGRSFTCGKDVERGNGRAEPTGAPAAFGEAATFGTGPAEMAGRSATCGKDVERGNGRAEPTGAPAASGEAATLGTGPAEMAGRSFTCGKDVERGNGRAEPTGAPAASGEAAALGTGRSEVPREAASPSAGSTAASEPANTETSRDEFDIELLELGGERLTELLEEAGVGERFAWENRRLIFNPRARKATAAQRREILRRDGHCCRTPGCPHRMWLQVHHEVYFSQQGETVRANLLPLCFRCHRNVHRGYLKITGNADGTLTFRDARGRNLLRAHALRLAGWMNFWTGWGGDEGDSHRPDKLLETVLALEGSVDSSEV